jgi:uncharacterized protein (UPF0335 family)
MIKKPALYVAFNEIIPSLDHLFHNPILQLLPIIKDVYNLALLIKSISDRIFIEKLSRFLFEIDKLSSDQKEKFLETYGEDTKSLQRIGEILILLIDKLDDMEKTEMAGKAFCSFVRGEISFEHFQRIGMVLNNTLLCDLKSFCRGNPLTDRDFFIKIEMTGLVTKRMNLTTAIGETVKVDTLEITEIGRIFQTIYAD